MRFALGLVAGLSCLMGSVWPQTDPTESNTAGFSRSASMLLDFFVDACMSGEGRDYSYDNYADVSGWEASGNAPNASWNMFVENVGWYRLSVSEIRRGGNSFGQCRVSLAADGAGRNSERLHMEARKIREVLTDHPLSATLNLNGASVIEHETNLNSIGVAWRAWPPSDKDGEIFVAYQLIETKGAEFWHDLHTLPHWWFVDSR